MKEGHPKGIVHKSGEYTMAIGAVTMPVGFFFSIEVFGVGAVALALGAALKSVANRKN